GFDLIKRYRFATIILRGLYLEKATDRVHPGCCFIHRLGKLAVAILAVAANSMLQGGYCIRGPRMRLATHPIGIFTADIESTGKYRILAKCCQMTRNRLLGDLCQSNSLDGGRRAKEVFVDKF